MFGQDHNVGGLDGRAAVAARVIEALRLNEFSSSRRFNSDILQHGLTPELSRAAQWRKLCASVAQAQR